MVALKNFSLDVRQHEFIGIVGPNGAGKTTLFDLLTGFQRPTGGELKLGGETVTGWAPYRLARAGIRRTFQIPRPFGRLSVYENVMLGGIVEKDPDSEELKVAIWRVTASRRPRAIRQSAGGIARSFTNKVARSRPRSRLATGPSPPR